MKNNDYDYIKDLAAKLPELKKNEGFPLADARQIIAISEPPYFTACPNPFISDILNSWNTPYDDLADKYHREPFIGDIVEGKKDPIYKAHSYHTKVPYKAIIPYIENYTEKGDIVYDGFCGSGMTGIAAQKTKRKAVLSDLSPIASFISYNYNSPISQVQFTNAVYNILNSVEEECGWMYETLHIDNKTKCRINYVVWSQVFICPFCKSEYIFFDEAIDKGNGSVLHEYNCPECNGKIKKTDCERALSTFTDFNGEQISQTKIFPVFINYRHNEMDYEKRADENDFSLIERISALSIPYWFPSDLMMEKGEKWGDIWRAGIHLGMTRVHHFYLKRTLYVLSSIFEKIQKQEDFNIKSKLLFLFTGCITGLTLQQRYRHKSDFPNMILSGTIYIGSMTKEYYVIDWFRGKTKNLISFFKYSSSFIKKDSCVISCNSVINSNLPSNSIDYIFTDPPFGDNLMYSELNFIWESWLRVKTNNAQEAIINNSQNKRLEDYSFLMLSAFQEYYRVLKPRRWITVVFHNSRSSVWNAIQDSLAKAGFIIAQVSILDKKQSSFKQITSPGAVEKDLVISAYKPTKSFEEKFIKSAGANLEIDFIYQFLENIPKRPCVERTDKMLYSKMLAFYIQRGYEVNYDSKSFYHLLQKNFIEEDGFWFTTIQINSYREYKQKMKLEGIEDIRQGSILENGGKNDYRGKNRKKKQN